MAVPEKSIREKLKAKTERWIQFFTGVVTRTPWLVLWSTLFAFLVCMGLLVAVRTTLTPSSEYEWELPKQKFTLRRDMILDAQDDVDAAYLPERSDPTWDTYFFYDADPLNYANKCEGPLGVFSPANVKAACETERLLWSRSNYEKFCYLPDGLTECPAPSDSVVSLAYNYEEGPLLDAPFLECPQLSDSELSARWDFILEDLRSPNPRYSFYFDEKAGKRGYPCKSRSFISFGTPLAGESDVSIWDDSQYRKIDREIASKIDSDLVDEYDLRAPTKLQTVYLDRARAGESGRKMDVLWTSAFVENAQFMDAVNADFMWALASIVFVWVWICLHTNSFVVGCVSMLQIIFSLPLAAFFYRVILQIKYLQIMQQLVIFVILGIGADDVFVYTDAWKQSAAKFPDEADLQKRIAFSYSRAFQSIFNTSFTTAVAFLATAISRLPPISSFGIFAALCVIMNFALVLTVTPAIVVIVHRRCLPPRPKNKQQLELVAGKKNDDDDDDDDDLVAKNKETTTTTKSEDGKEDPPTTDVEKQVVVVVPPKEEEEEENNDENEKDDDDAKKKSTCCCWCAAEDEPQSSWCDADSWVRSYLRLLTMGQSTEAAVKNDGEEDSPTTKEEATTTKKKHFKPVAWCFVLILGGYAIAMATLASRLTPPAQPEVWFPSAHMATRTDKLFDSTYGSNDASYYPILSIVWGMDRLKRTNFDQYVPHKNRGEVRYTNKPRLFQRSAQQQVLRACEGLRTFNCESGCVGESLTRPNSTVCFLEEFQAWHLNVYEEDTYDLDQDTFDSRLIRFRDETTPSDDSTSTSWKELIGVVDGELRFFRLDARLSLDLEEAIEKKNQVLRRSNKFVSRYCRDLDTELPGVWQSSSAWIWLKAQAELVNGLLSGMAIAFPIALLVLAGATGNVVLAIYAIVTIGSIVSSVLGLAYMLGWALGIKESVAGIVVIGLAVDYTLHLGHMYHHDGRGASREQKVASAVLTMGATVFNGAITTAGAAVFLLLTQLTFFSQMGILILATVISSLIYSLFFFVPLLYVAGPEGAFGNLKTIQHAIERACRHVCCKSKTADQPPRRDEEEPDEEEPNEEEPNDDSNQAEQSSQ